MQHSSAISQHGGRAESARIELNKKERTDAAIKKEQEVKMKFSFKALLGAVPSIARTTHEVVAYGVWIKKEERKN